MQSLTRLKHIVAVARSRSFSIAAEEAGISQPALSRSIQAFEAHYGLRLFDRGKGGVEVTPAGRLAVAQAQRLLDSAGAFDREMAMFGRGAAGRTGIGMGPLLASLLLPELGAAMMRGSPELTCLTRVGPPEHMLEALLAGDIELIVGNAWQVGLVPGVCEERLGTMRLVIMVRAGHPLAGRGRLTMRELEAFPTAGPYDLATGGEGGGAFICENFSVLRAVVLGSDCKWLATPALAADDIAAGAMVALDIVDLPNATFEVSLVHLRDRTRSPASIALANHVRALVRAQGAVEAGA